ncbi:hypothetical protein LTR17_018685 [Elasticomyces elasticus]|nr:hypothetical protein LTR17_018685 [Elasticomyces elasticus]
MARKARVVVGAGCNGGPPGDTWNMIECLQRAKFHYKNEQEHSAIAGAILMQSTEYSGPAPGVDPADWAIFASEYHRGLDSLINNGVLVLCVTANYEDDSQGTNDKRAIPMVFAREATSWPRGTQQALPLSKLENLVLVGAVNEADGRYANYGPRWSWIKLWAPGFVTLPTAVSSMFDPDDQYFDMVTGTCGSIAVTAAVMASLAVAKAQKAILDAAFAAGSFVAWRETLFGITEELSYNRVGPNVNVASDNAPLAIWNGIKGNAFVAGQCASDSGSDSDPGNKRRSYFEWRKLGVRQDGGVNCAEAVCPSDVDGFTCPTSTTASSTASTTASASASASPTETLAFYMSTSVQGSDSSYTLTAIGGEDLDSENTNVFCGNNKPGEILDDQNTADIFSYDTGTTIDKTWNHGGWDFNTDWVNCSAAYDATINDVADALTTLQCAASEGQNQLTFTCLAPGSGDFPYTKLDACPVPAGFSSTTTVAVYLAYTCTSLVIFGKR